MNAAEDDLTEAQTEKQTADQTGEAVGTENTIPKTDTGISLGHTPGASTFEPEEEEPVEEPDKETGIPEVDQNEVDQNEVDQSDDETYGLPAERGMPEQ